jgi:hypothetical protein
MSDRLTKLRRNFTAQNLPPEPFAGVAEAFVIFDPQETIVQAMILPYMVKGG